MKIIAIDPGAKGGIALLNEFNLVSAYPMPKGMTEQIDYLNSLMLMGYNTAVIEKVGTYVPGNAGPGAVKFARHCGHLEAAVYALKMSAVMVSPQKWMKQLGSFSKEVNQRKRDIKELMQRRYPDIKVTLTISDALGILTWYVEREMK